MNRNQQDSTTDILSKTGRDSGVTFPVALILGVLAEYGIDIKPILSSLILWVGTNVSLVVWRLGRKQGWWGVQVPPQDEGA